MKNENKEKGIWKDWKTWAIIILVIVLFYNFNSSDSWKYQMCVDDCMSENWDCVISQAVLIEDYGGYIHKLDYELCHYDLEDCLYECKE